MIHFISNLSSYLMVEVVESSYSNFINELNTKVIQKFLPIINKKK
jgi:hypothetical protein